MILNIIDKLNEWVQPFKAWVDANHNNPLLWIGFFVIGLAVFFMRLVLYIKIIIKGGQYGRIYISSYGRWIR